MASLILDPLVPESVVHQSSNDAAQVRAARILATEVEFLASVPYARLTEQPLDLQRYTAASRIAAADEVLWFRQLNLARYRAACLRSRLRADSPDTHILDEFDRLQLRGDQIRNRLAIVFSKLVLSIAQHYATSRYSLDDLVNEGQATLLVAIPKFDPERGFRFSTYATHAVRRRLLRYLRRGQRDREMFAELPYDDRFPDSRRWSLEYERRVTTRLERVTALLPQLRPRERYILRSRFGWGREFEPRTLQDIADELGISRERVRQLEARALGRLRELAEHDE